jgi:type IV secretory pathway TrbL component
MASETILSNVFLTLALFFMIKFILWNKILDFFYMLFVNKYSFSIILVLLIALVIEPSLWSYYETVINYFIDGFKAIYKILLDFTFSLLFEN